jgi:hypothetical protein
LYFNVWKEDLIKISSNGAMYAHFCNSITVNLSIIITHKNRNINNQINHNYKISQKQGDFLTIFNHYGKNKDAITTKTNHKNPD